MLLGLAMPFAARAQVDTREGIFLQNQIQELKRDIQSLRDQINRMGGASAGAAASTSSLGASRQTPAMSPDVTTALLDRVARLEDEVRQLRGRADESDNSQKRMGEDLAKQIDDLNFKVDGGLAKPGTTPAKPPVVNSGSPPAGTLPVAPAVTTPTAAKRTAEVALQDGNAALARRDYPNAEAAAREVLANPKSPRAGDAQFLLAQALSGKKDYQGAAVAYDDSYSRARTGTHAQDSLLGLANSLNAIGEKRAACATLDKMKAEFPTTRADLKDQVGSARKNAGCH